MPPLSPTNSLQSGNLKIQESVNFGIQGLEHLGIWDQQIPKNKNSQNENLSRPKMWTRFGLLSGINVMGLFVPISKRRWFFKSSPRFSEIDIYNILKSLNLMAASRLNERSRVTTSNKLYPTVYRKDSTGWLYWLRHEARPAFRS